MRVLFEGGSYMRKYGMYFWYVAYVCVFQCHMQYAEIQKELKLRPAIGVYGNQIANGAQHLQEKVNKICLIKQFIYIH